MHMAQPESYASRILTCAVFASLPHADFGARRASGQRLLA